MISKEYITQDKTRCGGRQDIMVQGVTKRRNLFAVSGVKNKSM